MFVVPLVKFGEEKRGHQSGGGRCSIIRRRRSHCQSCNPEPGEDKEDEDDHNL